MNLREKSNEESSELEGQFVFDFHYCRLYTPSPMLSILIRFQQPIIRLH